MVTERAATMLLGLAQFAARVARLRTRWLRTSAPRVPKPQALVPPGIPIRAAHASNPQTYCDAQFSRLRPGSTVPFPLTEKILCWHTPHSTPTHAESSASAQAIRLSAPICPTPASTSDSRHPTNIARRSFPFRPRANAPPRIPPHPQNSIRSQHIPASSHSENPKQFSQSASASNPTALLALSAWL